MKICETAVLLYIYLNVDHCIVVVCTTKKDTVQYLFSLYVIYQILFYCYVYKLSYSCITKSIELTERQRGHMIEFVQSSVVSYYSVILNYNYLFGEFTDDDGYYPLCFLVSCLIMDLYYMNSQYPIRMIYLHESN